MKIGHSRYREIELEIFYEKQNVYSKFRKLASRVKHNKRPYHLSTNGPGEVLNTLKKGLSKWPTTLGTFPIETHWVISGKIPRSFENSNSKNSILLLGPNIEFHKIDLGFSYGNNKHTFYLAPAEWVAPVLVERLNVQPSKILIWPSGVDTTLWEPRQSKTDLVLVYLKGHEDQRYRDLIEFLVRNSIPHSILKYGEYSPRKFRQLLNRARFAVWISGTESQGLAILQCWSMNVPTFVFRKDKYFDPVSKKEFDASSAPYLNEHLGQFSNTENFDESEFRKFIADVTCFKPREFVVREFNLRTTILNLKDQLTKLVT
jgi:hypothetical protein